jgi:hypothetical protein
MKNQSKKILKKYFYLVVVMISIFCISSFASAAISYSDVNRKSTPYGILTGSNSISKYSNYEKQVSLSTSCEKKAEKLFVAYHIQYTDGSTIGYLYNYYHENATLIGELVEMHHWKNKITNKYDGFLNTPIISYGSHEIRGNTNAYVVYTSIKN